MAHIVEVDQSGKFETTKMDTVLAFSDGISFSILIPSTVKRDCLTILRNKKTLGPTLYDQLFATGLFFLLRNYIERMNEVIIDTEYKGREAGIKDHLINILHRAGRPVRREQISFGYVGKQSPAHKIALATLKREQNPNLILTVEDILGQFKH
jgi:hypothetical protein